MQTEPEIRYLKSFILYTIIALITGMVVGAIQGAILGAILGGAGIDVRTIQITCGITGFVFGAVASFFIFRWIIRTQILPQLAKHYEQQHP